MAQWAPTLFVNSFVCDAHNTQHLLGNSAPVQNEFHIGQCGFVGSSRECRLHNRAKLGWKIQIDPPTSPWIYMTRNNLNLYFQWPPILRIMHVLWGVFESGVWLCWRRVRAKSTFSFVMQLNTTAAYNWGQCSLICLDPLSFTWQYPPAGLPYWRTIMLHNAQWTLHRYESGSTMSVTFWTNWVHCGYFCLICFTLI